VEAGSNTSTVTLRVVGGDEMGSLKSVTVKYGRESQEIRTQELRCASLLGIQVLCLRILLQIVNMCMYETV
jgi:hypothetical protein